jgi:biopolymer transport protein ExbB/TolQ
VLEFLTSTLYRISNSLLIPVILIILALLVWTALLLGGFLREWYERRKLTGMLRASAAAARDRRSPEEIWQMLEEIPYGLPKRFMRFVAGSSDEARVLAQALTNLENDVASSVARHSFITRVAPVVGLMGTLIPLGPALNGLASGNMQALSGNLIVAFTATVIGLLIGAVAYGMGLARRTWYARDLSNLEFIVDTITAKEFVTNA